MSKKMLLSEVAIVLAPVLAAVYFWDVLPDQIPQHYNLKGEVDAYASKRFVFFLPAVNLVLAMILNVVPKIDPRSENFAKFRPVYNGIVLGILGFVSLLSLSEILTQAGVPFIRHMQTLNLVGYLLGFLFLFLGLYMKRIEPNYFVGVRTPWTLENAEVWRKTHLFSGKLFVGTGIATVALRIVANDPVFFVGMTVLLLGATLVSVVYSYLEFQKVKKREATE